MNLVAIAAVIAVASAAKLDRTYLPPASAKTAGGSPGALQTPFSSNSFNQGLGGIPKGAFENDFKGVVVDAASPGTRASGDGETGLGAPRIAYGSTNSKVGEAAFRGSPAGFRQSPQQSQFANQQTQFGSQQGQIPDGQTAGTSVSAQSFAQGPGQSFETNYQRSQELTARDQNANIVRFDSNVGTDSFSYSFETDNGISAEESGVATNGVQAQGGFSYTGDDGQVYSVTYTADEGGYQPKGDHLPTPPPIPEEILKSLEQNAREEAAGLVDDGSYDAQKYNEGGDYTENDGASTHNGRQPAQFGNRPESDASVSGTFINQNNQPFVKPDVNGQAGQTEQNIGTASIGSSPNRFSQSSASANSPNGFGHSNQAISNRFQQNRPTVNSGIEDSDNANTFVSPTFETISQVGTSQNFIQGQDKQQSSLRRPQSDRPQSNLQKSNGQNSGTSNTNNIFGSSVNNRNSFGQQQPSGQFGNSFGNKEYLPPVNNFNRNPPQSSSQKPISSFDATHSFNQFSQASTGPQENLASSSAFVSGSTSNVKTQNSQFGGFQNNQFAGNKPTSSPSPQNFADTTSGLSSFKPQQSTAQPLTELTTPLEEASLTQRFGVQSSQSRPMQSLFGRPPAKNGATQFSAPASTSASAFASATAIRQDTKTRPEQSNVNSSPFVNQRVQSTVQLNQENVFGQSQPSNEFTQNQLSEAQFAQSTQRPTFNQNTQAQGPDDSYYYNQPSKAFSTPNTQVQASRFPNTPFNQFNRVTQRPSSSSQSNAQATVSRGNFQSNSFVQNSQLQESQRYPQPPVLPSVSPTLSVQKSTAATFNGITQASASSFTSGAPTLSTPFGSRSPSFDFDRRPTQQTNGQFDIQATQSTSTQQGFGKQTTALPHSFSSGNRNQFENKNSFQIQQTTSNGNQQPSTSDNSPTVPIQQYDGEIYEYNKPAQTLPPPTEEDKKAGFGQFGRQPTKPQFNQQEKSQESNDAQSGSTQARPTFASQVPRQQFGQKAETIQQTQAGVQLNSRQQFGQQTTSFANAQTTQTSSFAQGTDAENAPTGIQGNQFNGQANLNADSQSVQQFGSRPFKNQAVQFNGQANNQQTGSQVENRPRPSCCKQLATAPQVQPTQSNQFVAQSQGQFGVSDSNAHRPDQSSAQSFMGQGEVFGGPRKPPSFDQEKGYHY